MPVQTCKNKSIYNYARLGIDIEQIGHYNYDYVCVDWLIYLEFLFGVRAMCRGSFDGAEHF